MKSNEFYQERLKRSNGHSIGAGDSTSRSSELKQQITGKHYSTIDAQNIATRFTQNTYQALGSFNRYRQPFRPSIESHYH